VIEDVTRYRAQGAEGPGTAERLRAAVARLFHRSDRAWARTSLTSAGASVLASIVRHGPLRLSLLAATESMNPTMLSRLVHDLEKAGLVTRQVAPSDHRAPLVEATAAGERLHRKIGRQRGELSSLGLSRPSSAERAAIVEGLSALEALAEQLKAQDP
jgi:DNA-binding MarR family transcriptional regulator